VFKRLGLIVERGTDLLEAEGRLALRSAERAAATAAATAAAYIGLALVGAAGLLALLAAAAVGLAEVIGTAWSLAAVGGACLVIMCIGIVIVRALLRPPPAETRTFEQLKAEADYQESAFKEAIRGDAEPAPAVSANGASPSQGSGLRAAAESFLSTPTAVAGAVFAAVSILGPVRTVRLLTKGAAAAGLAATLTSSVRDAMKAVDGVQGLRRGIHL
jgi:hypothetical protein